MTQSASDFGLKQNAEKAEAVRDGDRFSASLKKRDISQLAYRKPPWRKPGVALATASGLGLETVSGSQKRRTMSGK